MKKITIYQKHSDNIELFDNDPSISEDKYYEELSKLFTMGNIAILKTDQSVFIGRPSQINSIIVEDININENKSEEIINTESQKEEVKESESIDIITDL